MNYLQRFIRDFKHHERTYPRRKHGEFILGHLHIARDKIWSDEFYMFDTDLWITDITITATQCFLTNHIRCGHGHPNNKTEQREISYEFVLGLMRGHEAHPLSRLIKTIGDVYCGEPTHIDLWSVNYLDRFYAEFTFPDREYVGMHRNFLTCVFGSSIKARHDSRIIARYDSIVIIVTAGYDWKITARGCYLMAPWGKLRGASYDEVYEAAKHTPVGRPYHFGRAFEKIIAGALPQPIAEEIVPHLCRGLRSYAWWLRDD